MTGLARWWTDPTRRCVITTLAWTAVIVGGTYGEAHPNQPADIVQNGHHVPYTPDAAPLLVAVATLVLAGRIRYPRTVLVISTAAVTTYTLLGYENGAALLAPTVALYAVALTVTVRRAVIAAALTLVVLMASTGAANPFGTTSGGFFLIPGLVAAALFGGIAISNRRAFFASIQARAEDEARRRADEERLRIARELHDVVAHTMSTINVQASAAALMLTERPDDAAKALQAIRTASKNGLRELRAILNVLRQADEADPITPAPGLAQLDALIAGAVQAGLPTTLRRTGEKLTLPAEVDLAAYRIIQESLTNTIHHAGPATATVDLDYRDSELLIEVADTGRGALTAGHGVAVRVTAHGVTSKATVHSVPTAQGNGGHGLIGMRERAAAAGGTVHAGPARGGGYHVTARLPFTGPDEHATPDERGSQDQPAGAPLAPPGKAPARDPGAARR